MQLSQINFVGQFTLKLLELGFEASMGLNKKMIQFSNKKQQTVWITIKPENLGIIELGIYNANGNGKPYSIIPLPGDVYNQNDIERFVNLVKQKLKL